MDQYPEVQSPPSWAAHLLPMDELRPETDVLRELGIDTNAPQRGRWRTRRVGPRLPAIYSRFRWWTTEAAVREWLRRAPEIAQKLGVEVDAA